MSPVSYRVGELSADRITVHDKQLWRAFLSIVLNVAHKERQKMIYSYNVG